MNVPTVTLRLTSIIALAAATFVVITIPGEQARASYPGPNGKILFVSSRDGGDGDIFHMNADGTNQTQLTINSAEDTTPTWSADGSKIVFSSNRDGDSEIFVMNADGSGQVQLTFNTAKDGSPHFSPDGSKIAFFSDRDGNSEIYVMGATGADQTRLTNNTGIDTEPFWSPSGAKLVFYGERGSDLEIFVINANGTAETQLTVNDGINDVQPDWSPDGTKILFARGAAVANGGLDIWVMDADGSGETQLTDSPAVDNTPSYSPDGTKIAFASDRNDVPDIFVMNSDGTGQTQITFEPYVEVLPDWQVLPAIGADSDNDGLADRADNCPNTPNPDQVDVCSLRDGDYLVGVGEPTGGGQQKGKIVRVRGGEQTDFCESQSWNRSVPPFFQIPSEVLIDAQGRVVFLAYLGSVFDADAGWGLWRCDAMGELPTLIAAFGANPSFGYPNPRPGQPAAHLAGLHLRRTSGIDLNTGTAVEHELYVFAIGDGDGGRSWVHDTLGYDPVTGHFTTYTLDDPVPNADDELDMINISGDSGFGFPANYTVSVSDNKMRAVLEPIRLDFTIGDFTGGLAFQKVTDLEGLHVDDLSYPNTPACPSGPGHADNYPFEFALSEGGTIGSMTGFNLLAGGDGLVIQGQAQHPFLSRVSLAHMDLSAENDAANYHHLPALGCTHARTLQHVPWHPFNSYNDEDGVARSVRQMDPAGTVGTHYHEGRIVKVGPTDGKVQILATGLNLPAGIDVYPGFRPPLGGVAIFVKIESPVDVLLTGPDGRRIGVDADNLPVNDYGDAGYDSQTDEPHVYGIRDPSAGDYTMAIKGTGNGPYKVTTYGVDLATLEVTKSSVTGTASPGSQEQAGFSVDDQGRLETPPPTTTTTTTTSTTTTTTQPPPTSASCARPTIVGTAGPDTIRGTNGRDVIDSRGGNDKIYGLGGDDVICAGSGRDFVSGGDGNDTIVAGGGRDQLHGGDGRDRIFGGDGPDVVRGGNGDDLLRGGRGDDSIAGDAGNDDVFGDQDNDALDGGPGLDDNCAGGFAVDTATNCEHTTGIP